MPTLFSECLIKQAGINLLEVLIVLSTASMICNMLLYTYSGATQSMQFQQHINAFQYKAQRLTRILTSAIKQAGFIGCARLTKNFPVSSGADFKITAQNKLSGTANELIVRYIDGLSNTVHAISSTRVVIDNEIPLHIHSVLMIHDCQQIEIFQPEKIIVSHHQQVLTLKQPLQFVFKDYTEISRLNINRYYLANTKRRNPDGSFVKALYVSDIHQRKTELVSGIQTLRFHYYSAQGGQLYEIFPDKSTGENIIVAVNIELEIQVADLKRPWFIWVALQA